MMKAKAILSLTALMLGLCQGVQAQQKWDFTQTPANDIRVLSSNGDAWSYDDTKKRYENTVDIDGAIKASNTELELTKGLTVKAAAKKFRIDVDQRIQLAGKNIPLATPALKKGQVVTIVFASTGSTAVTFDVLSNLSGTEL